VRRVYHALCEGILTVYPHTVAAYCDLWGVCAVRCVRVYCINTVYPHTVRSAHASQVAVCGRSTDNVLYELWVSTLSQVCDFSWVLAVAP